MALSDAGPQIFTLSCPANEQETLTQDEGYPTIKGCEIAQFSPIHGKLLVAVSFEGIHIIDMETKQQVRLIEKKSVIAMEWSPNERYIITCQKFKEGQKNLDLWEAETGKLVTSFEWKNTATI